MRTLRTGTMLHLSLPARGRGSQGRAFMVGARRKGRILALQGLYEMDVSGHNPEEALKRNLEYRREEERAELFALALIRGVQEHKEKIDDMIRRYAPAWPVKQLPAVERNILRLAIYEVLLANDAPPRAAINEAVELAKAFGGDNASRFVNGVLGSIMAQETAGSKAEGL